MSTTLKIGIDRAFLVTGCTSGAEYRVLKENPIVKLVSYVSSRQT
jgi:hypothetical protein